MDSENQDIRKKPEQELNPELEQEMEQEPEPEQESEPDSGPQNAIERFYEHFRRVPVSYLDRFIVICIAAFLAVVVLGVLKGRGIL